MTNWEQLPNHTRVWVYQSDRVLTDVECERIRTESEQFVSNWASHGTDLVAAAHMFHNIFLVFFVDEQHKDASGCSIDKSVHFVKALERTYNINFFNRLNICVKENDNLRLVPLSNPGEVTELTRFYDNTIRTKSELIERWCVPVQGSWLDRYVEIKSH